MSKNEFKRHLDEPLFELLKAECENKKSLWRIIINEGDLFVFFRGHYLSVYYRGCCLFRIEDKSNELVYKIHYKYLIKLGLHEEFKKHLSGFAKRNPKFKKNYTHYIPFEEGRFNVTDILKKDFIKDFITAQCETMKCDTSEYEKRLFCSDLSVNEAFKNIKDASEYYSEGWEEKIGVHEILKDNNNILDIEIKLPNGQFDFVALQTVKNSIELVFFEAKPFRKVKVESLANQIAGYQKVLENEDKAKQIANSYRELCRQLNKLGNFDHLKPEYADKILNENCTLKINPKSRLVIFGYQEEDIGTTKWKNIYKELQVILPSTDTGERILMQCNPKRFTHGISSFK